MKLGQTTTGSFILPRFYLASDKQMKSRACKRVRFHYYNYPQYSQLLDFYGHINRLIDNFLLTLSSSKLFMEFQPTCIWFKALPVVLPGRNWLRYVGQSFGGVVSELIGERDGRSRPCLFRHIMTCQV